MAYLAKNARKQTVMDLIVVSMETHMNALMSSVVPSNKALFDKYNAELAIKFEEYQEDDALRYALYETILSQPKKQATELDAFLQYAEYSHVLAQLWSEDVMEEKLINYDYISVDGEWVYDLCKNTVGTMM